MPIDLMSCKEKNANARKKWKDGNAEGNNYENSFFLKTSQFMRNCDEV